MVAAVVVVVALPDQMLVQEVLAAVEAVPVQARLLPMVDSVEAVEDQVQATLLVTAA